MCTRYICSTWNKTNRENCFIVCLCRFCHQLRTGPLIRLLMLRKENFIVDVKKMFLQSAARRSPSKSHLKSNCVTEERIKSSSPLKVNSFCILFPSLLLSHANMKQRGKQDLKEQAKIIRQIELRCVKLYCQWWVVVALGVQTFPWFFRDSRGRLTWVRRRLYCAKSIFDDRLWRSHACHPSGNTLHIHAFFTLFASQLDVNPYTILTSCSSTLGPFSSCFPSDMNIEKVQMLPHSADVEFRERSSFSNWVSLEAEKKSLGLI